MGSLIEEYNKVVLKTKELNDKISGYENELGNLSVENSGAIEVRIENLEIQLKKIAEYLREVRAFQNVAIRNITSKNVSTIDAPEGYRINLNRLQQWAMLIDPNSADDPYAQRVYIVAKCDEHFLLRKQKEFETRIGVLKQELVEGETTAVEELKNKIAESREQLKQYATSEDVYTFARNVVSANSKNSYSELPEVFTNPTEPAATICPGAYAAYFAFDEEQRIALKALMGESYDEVNGRVLLPVEINAARQFIMKVNCVPSRRNELDKGIQNMIFQTINENIAGTRKVYVFDAVRYKSSCLGSLRGFEDTFALAKIPKNPDQLDDALEAFASSFSDIDDIIETYDSVSEYNAQADEGKQISLSTVVLYGWPHAFSSKAQEHVKRILSAYERYGVSVIAVAYQNRSENESDKDALPEYARQNSIVIDMLRDATTITFADKKPTNYLWYKFKGEVTEQYVHTYVKNESIVKTIGNEYTSRHDLTEAFDYGRSYKPLELPFGIDGKDEEYKISFENENFASYLVGASRSGKSTLIHTLIAGIIRNYHPDNVELWLADFKQLEFKRYIDHCPPHVKYILLDESRELVFDLIDKLTNEMLERQKIFARLGVQRLDQIEFMRLSKPLPVIFVILDEFSIMSQAIAQEDTYKLKLQNILAKGAALGIKFIFASQTFTSGVTGLTATARAQIQQRIAMKGSRDEISETLELSSNLKTEQVRNWMDALPPHYALVKFRTDADTPPTVKRFLVEYFKDYTVRDDMIENANMYMHPVEKYSPSDLSTYVNKNRVLVDGNTLNTFDKKELTKYISEYRINHAAEVSDEDVFVSFGTPRLMSRIKPGILSAETRENIILVARSAEMACAASINMSVIKSFLAQGGKVIIWAYEKNPLYRTYKKVFAHENVEIIEGIDDICDSIRKIKTNISNKITSKTLIVMIGMDRICVDFDFVDGPSGGVATTEAVEFHHNANTEVKSDEEALTVEFAALWGEKSVALRNELQAKGLSEKDVEYEVDQAYNKLYIEFYESKGYVFDDEVEETISESSVESNLNDINNLLKSLGGSDDVVSEADNQAEAEDKEVTEVMSGAYNALNDFVYIVKQGSRLGYHTMLNLNVVTDIRTCGLRVDYFTHKLSFQLSNDDSQELFGKYREASGLPEHICQYNYGLSSYSFRPFIHENIGWDGWFINEDGNLVSPFGD